MNRNLFAKPLSVLNVGVHSFGNSVSEAGGTVQLVDWQPPAGGSETARMLGTLTNHPRVERANRIAFERFAAASPVLTDVDLAKNLISALAERTILHAGPPVAWSEMCGPMRGAIAGAIVYEGWTETIDDAFLMAEKAGCRFLPAHQCAAVGPMAGVISPSMPLWRVENSAGGNIAFSTLNEGLGQVLRFGANGPNVIERLRWMQTILAPALREALVIDGPIELQPIMAQALHMGDEVHNRNVAASGLLLKRLLPPLLRTGQSLDTIASVVEFIAGNDHFFLNLSMAACKAVLDAAHDVPHSTMVTAMARNGVEFGLRVSGTGDEWHTAPAPGVDGLFFPGYTAADAARDLGDSAITESAGLGGFAMAASPAIVQFVGGSPADALSYSREMGHITLGHSAAFTLPALDFLGSPSGIDCRRVLDTGIAPIINTGIAHRDAGVGQIGAGIVRAPLACFVDAVSVIVRQLATIESLSDIS